MTMKIRAQLVKKLRTERLWSQDELAKLSGVGLRTIQRIEREGHASAETIKALAAVFEIDSASLLVSEANKGSVPYKNIQLGGLFVLILLVTVVVSSWFLDKELISGTVFTVIVLSTLAPTIVFSTLTVTVDSAKVEWYFGPRVWRKTQDLTHVNKVRIVRNKLWWGFGIRFYGGGWLYNVSGLDAVELQLNDGSRVRIGTDEPAELHAALSDAKLSL